MYRLAALILLAAAPTAAQGWSCRGEDPVWSLSLGGGTARLVFPGLTEMDVMLETRAERRDWPLALTLIGERDTAILVLEHEVCELGTERFAHRAHVLT